MLILGGAVVNTLWRTSKNALLCLLMLIATHRALSAELNVYVYTGPSGFSEDEVSASLDKLVARLGEYTGQTMVLNVSGNALEHWLVTRQPERAHVILDAAHFTDYRVKRHGFVVVARLRAPHGLTLVTSQGSAIVDPSDLHGMPVATLGPPSLASARLHQLFPDAVRAPVLVDMNSYREALEALASGEAAAAVIATDLVAERPELAVVAVYEDDPGLAVSVSPRVPAEHRIAIAKALLDGADFAPANASLYDGYAELLKGTWGF